MKNSNVIRELKKQSTWALVGLAIITYGIYLAYYAKKQTKIINEHIGPEKAIDDGLITSLLVVAYLALFFFIPSVTAFFMLEFGTENVGSLEVLDKYLGNVVVFVNNIFWVLKIVWGFKVRNRMNDLCELEKGNKDRFGWFLLLFIPVLYFNYKINVLKERLDRGEA